MERAELELALQSLSFSADLPATVLSELAAVANVARFPAGSRIFAEGSENHVLYLVCSGRVALDMNVPGRNAVRVLSLGPGDLLAWSALLGQGQMTTTATSLADTELIGADAQKLLQICEQRPEVGYPLMHRVALALSKRLVATRLQMLDLFSYPGGSR